MSFWTIDDDPIQPRSLPHTTAETPVPKGEGRSVGARTDRDWNHFVDFLLQNLKPFPDALRAIADAILQLPPELRGSPSSA